MQKNFEIICAISSQCTSSVASFAQTLCSLYLECVKKTSPGIRCSQFCGLQKANAARTPESESGQSFICRASICAAMTVVGGMRCEGFRSFKGSLTPLWLNNCANSRANC